jgi:hypothetical protein
MKDRGIDAVANTIIGSAGGVAFAIGASFAWYSKYQSVEHFINLHAALLTVIGAGILAATYSIRRANTRIAQLEDKLNSLQTRGG